MDTHSTIQNSNGTADSDILQSAKVLTPLELNGVKLDAKHTVLTPSYLEELIQNQQSDT